MPLLADPERIFPISEAESARFAMVKAECLHAAGVISEAEKEAVFARAKRVIDAAPVADMRGMIHRLGIAPGRRTVVRPRARCQTARD